VTVTVEDVTTKICRTIADTITVIYILYAASSSFAATAELLAYE